MSYLVIFKPHHNPSVLQRMAVDLVTVLDGLPSHPRSRRPQSPRPSDNCQMLQQLQAAAPAGTAGRRVGAGAGATPVLVPAIRHGTSLARRVSLVGRSRTCPSRFIGNPNGIRIQNEFVFKE